MSIANLIEADNITGCPFPFLDDTPMTFKIYNDGRHLVATSCRRPVKKPQDMPERRRKSDDLTQEQKDLIYRRVLRDKKIDFHPV